MDKWYRVFKWLLDHSPDHQQILEPYTGADSFYDWEQLLGQFKDTDRINSGWSALLIERLVDGQAVLKFDCC